MRKLIKEQVNCRIESALYKYTSNTLAKAFDPGINNKFMDVVLISDIRHFVADHIMSMSDPKMNLQLFWLLTSKRKYW
jgi:hypothetical protein